MKYLLDTCVCILYINRKSQQIRDNIHKHIRSDMVVSSITKCELYAGSAMSQTPIISRAKQDRFLNHFDSLPFDDAAARQYGEVQSYLRWQMILLLLPAIRMISDAFQT